MTHCKKRKNCSGRTVSTCSTPLVSCSPTSGSMSGRRASWPTASTRWPSPPPHHPSSSSQARWQPCTIETCSIPVTKPKCNATRKKVTSQLFLFLRIRGNRTPFSVITSIFYLQPLYCRVQWGDLGSTPILLERLRGLRGLHASSLHVTDDR